MKPRERSCRPRFSPLGHFNQVSLAVVQQQLRHAWSLWGLPRRIKVDNGSPWGSWSDLPPKLAMWMVGMDIDLTWIPPGCPQRNGVTERSHGVTQRWVEAGQCHSAAELQQRVNREDRVQREKYPHRGGLSRWASYPGLQHSGRIYEESREAAVWSWQRVCEHLAEYAVDRKVDRCGKIGLYHDKVYVGVVLRGRSVIVQFDPKTEEWIVADGNGAELCRRPLTQFDSNSLRHLPGSCH
jgi:hypothetical protein